MRQIDSRSCRSSQAGSRRIRTSRCLIFDLQQAGSRRRSMGSRLMVGGAAEACQGGHADLLSPIRVKRRRA
ncbi:unnamed protein product [Urochloa humidicola]